MLILSNSKTQKWKNCKCFLQLVPYTLAQECANSLNFCPSTLKFVRNHELYARKKGGKSCTEQRANFSVFFAWPLSLGGKGIKILTLILYLTENIGRLSILSPLVQRPRTYFSLNAPILSRGNSRIQAGQPGFVNALDLVRQRLLNYPSVTTNGVVYEVKLQFNS